MKKQVLALAIAIAVLGLGVPATATAAMAAPIENLSPENGSTIEGHGQETYVEFTCPAYGKFSWQLYKVNFSTSNAIGENELGEGKLGTWNQDTTFPAMPINASETICKATMPWVNGEQGKTNVWYWQVEREECYWVSAVEHEGCESFGPIWEVGVERKEHALPTTRPTNPHVTPKPTRPTVPPAVPEISVWTGCALSPHSPAMVRCKPDARLGAFIHSDVWVSYTVCVRVPAGKRSCLRNRSVRAGLASVYRIADSELGRYKVTWIVDSKRYVRYLHRIRA